MQTDASRALPNLPAELSAELEATAAQLGCELLHVELKGGILRLVLDRADGGVTLSDCEQVSRRASALLDLYDFGRSRYTLEVSSPGLDRQLFGPRDYQRFQGHRVRVTFKPPSARNKRTVTGRLEAFETSGEGRIEVEVDETGERIEIPLPEVLVARLEIEL
ncbi:MAG TPA: ribosome maturation factor RimP [Thermoanaerobaculia bacterium]|nr:ribosome maturation factor RimP [Thermoanaerobaculia bacterium]